MILLTFGVCLGIGFYLGKMDSDPTNPTEFISEFKGEEEVFDSLVNK